MALTGNAEFQFLTWNPLLLRFLTFTMMAELNVPFVFLDLTYTHIVAAVDPSGVRLWNYVGRYAPWPWFSHFSWATYTQGFPFGANVVPDQ